MRSSAGSRASSLAGLLLRSGLLAGFAWTLGSAPAAAQGHLLRLAAGAGAQLMAHDELKLSRGFGVGGGAAFRFNDSLSFEAGLHFGRSNRRYTERNEPVEDVLAVPAYQYRTNRYHLDGSFVYHLGRRQPFQLYVLAGAGIVRREEVREDYTYDDPDPPDPPDPDNAAPTRPTGVRIPIGVEISLDSTEHTFTAHVGAGFEVYVLSYLSARAEYRIWSGSDFGFRTQQFLVGVNYYR